jgi:YVTN family beta-propeller protein
MDPSHELWGAQQLQNRFQRMFRRGMNARDNQAWVAIIDGATKKALKYVLVGQRVWRLALTPDDKLLFATNGVSNDVAVIDVASLKAVKSIPVGSYPWGVAITRQ